MCGIWKMSQQVSTELTLEQLQHILADRLFSKLEYININGGEPSLREDLPEIFEMIIQTLPRLTTIAINSNGLNPEKVLLHTKKIAKICRENKIRLSISISLHQTGEAYDEIAGVRNAFTNVLVTLRNLKAIHLQEKFYVAVNCVLSNLNVYNSYNMLEWSEKEGVPINFTYAEVRDRFNNQNMANDIAITDNEKKIFLINFFRHLARDTMQFKQHTLRYKSIADMLEFNSVRALSCHYAMGGLILGADGSLYYCKKGKTLGSCTDRSAFDIYYDSENLLYRNKELLNRVCQNCIPNSFIKMEIEKDLFKCIGHFISQ